MLLEKENVMNKLYVCVFGGTTEGRLLVEYLAKKQINTDLYVTTEYAEQFIKKTDSVSVFQNKLDKEEMINLFRTNAYSHIIDATHPFARLVSENILLASEQRNLRYLRVVRENKCYESCIYVDSMQDAVDLLKNEIGNVLLTTGSKNLELFTELNDYKERVYPRILPMEDSLKKAIQLGYSNKNIICMQGPFSTELNEAMIRFVNAKFLLSKESDASGGLEEKVKACENLACKCIVVRKPVEAGYSLEEMKGLIEKDMI